MSGLIYLLVFWPMAGAIISYIIGLRSKEARNYFADFTAVSEFVLMLYAAVYLRGCEVSAPFICGMGLHFTVDGFRGIYGTIATFMWMMTMIYSREYFKHYRNRNRYYLFQLITLGATVGVFLSANLYTTFIFFEIMSLASYVWVAQNEDKEAMRAADTYLAVAIIGGMVLLMGLFLLYDATGTLEIAKLHDLCEAYPDKRRLYIAGGCMLFGFGAKAGAFPLHIWLPKAHPVAPAPASALLSGILTKSGVYGVIIISAQMFYGDQKWGMLILVLGMITMFLGALLALFSVNLKRTLACSSMSQIGFIMIGIAMQCFLGEENSLAVYGTFLHMMNHSLIKLVLFIAAGVVFMNLHQLELDKIRGFGHGKPLLHFSFLMGALGIGGIPFWNGYISKTLLHEAIVEYGGGAFFTFAEWVFLVSGGLTVAYMTKLYICLFCEHNNDHALQEKFNGMNKTYINWQSRFALGGSAIVLPILGMTSLKTMMPLAMASGSFMRVFEEGHIPHFFEWECLKGGLISIGIGVIIYVFIVRTLFIRATDHGMSYVNNWPEKLDLENLIYRPLLLDILPFIGIFVSRIGDCLLDTIVLVLRMTIYRDRKIPYRTGKLPHPAHVIGSLLDKGADKLHVAEHHMDYKLELRAKAWALDEHRAILRGTLSYGMLMAGIGMVIVFVYLLS